MKSIPQALFKKNGKSENRKNLLGACGCAAWWGTDKTQKYYQSHCHTVAGPLIAKADELPVHNRKGVGNQKEKGGGGTLKLEEAPLELFQHTVGRF